MVLRFSILIAALILAYSFLIFHLYQLQVIKGGYYSARAQSIQLASGVIKANRGIIYFTDKNNNHLIAALNEDFPLIYGAPKSVDDPVEAANILGPILNRPVSNLQAVLSKPNDPYEVLLKKAGSSIVEKINELKIKGIYVDNEPGRFYPFNELASQVLGFVGPSDKNDGDTGHYGIEEFYENMLGGEAGKISGAKVIAAKAGQDLILTLDPNIQIEAERVLDKLVVDYKATGGSVIVEDPQSGKILAMGSYPNFDPNNYGSARIADFLNPVTQQIYEPGSVFKVITMATGIDSGKITPDTTYVDTGSVTLNGKTIQNYDIKTHGAYGKVTMTNVMEHSINTGAVFAERRIGRDIFTSYLKNFGFSEKTGVDLPAEVAGDLRRLNPKERDIAFATASYGQGVAVTPLELITAISAIANGGVMMRPYLNMDLQPQVIHRVISVDAAKQVTQMMVSAVDKAGVAKINGFTVAGKTGTAFIPDFKKGGYTDNVIDSYVGFAPATNPKFIVLIKLDSLPSTTLAAQSVVPAFGELAQFILNYYGIAPDRI
jgi:cell division protein FtsI/penicillin-binding protein 2